MHKPFSQPVIQKVQKFRSIDMLKHLSFCIAAYFNISCYHVRDYGDV